MNEAIAITVVNAVISISLFIGIYKNKIDNMQKMIDKYNNLENRITRLEEKINFVIEKLK
jgi:hypothetical protein